MKMNEIFWAIATNLIANIFQKLIETQVDLSQKPNYLITMISFLPAIALFMYAVFVLINRYIQKNEAKHVLGDIIRDYENTPIEPLQQLYSAAHSIPSNEEIRFEDKLKKENKIKSITQQLAEKFGDKIFYSDLKKMVTERVG